MLVPLVFPINARAVDLNAAPQFGLETGVTLGCRGQLLNRCFDIVIHWLGPGWDVHAHVPQLRSPLARGE